MSELSLYLPEDRSGILPLAYFHALARLGLDGLVLIEPADTFVSVGYFDDTASVLDLDRCRDLGLPVARREVGGGPVLLGPGQVFYHLILPRDHPALPARLEDVYQAFSEPVLRVYRRFGVEATFRPVNDLVAADGRKITGQGAADIGERFCFVGAVLRHFDSRLMAQVLRVPDEKLRGRLHATLEGNISSIAAATGTTPSSAEVIAALATELAETLGPLTRCELPAEARDLSSRLALELQDPTTLFAPRTRQHAEVKIREGVVVRHGLHKAPGGLLRTSVTVAEGVIVDVELSGDLTCVPKAGFATLARALVGCPFDAASVLQVLEPLLARSGLQCPGVSPADLAQAVTRGAGPA